MKILVSFCLLFLNIINNNVFASIDNKEQSIYEELKKKKLPYPCTQEEIDALPEGTDKTQKQELYDFMKLSFNVISHKKDELNKQFLSEDTDLDLINHCKEILKNPDNYKHINENYNKQYETIQKLLQSNDDNTIKYVNDIIHNNFYSAIFDILIDTGEIDSNNFKYLKKQYITETVIKKIYDKIKNKYRKEIINSALKVFLLYEVPDTISIDNYKAYIMRTNGIHRDNYNNYTNHIIFHGLSFNSFIQIINNLNHDDLKVELETFRTLVRDGYITNPYIVDYINDRC